MAGASLKYRVAFRAIQGVLVHQWDPICSCDGTIPQDEYDSYIPVLYRLALEGADEIVIAQHLEQLETHNMGLSSGGNKNLVIAKRIRDIVNELTD